MPKVRPLIWSPAPQCDTLKKNIKICMIKSNMTADKLAVLLDVSRATAYNKIREPKKLEFEELCRFAHIFKVDVTDLVREGGV